MHQKHDQRSETAPTPESKQPKCPYCGEPMKLGDGCYWCMNKKCAEQFYPSGNDESKSTSKQEWCVTTARKAFVNARAEQLDAEIVSEGKPTSEGARELADKLLGEITEIFSDYGFNGPIYHYGWQDTNKAVAMIEAYAAPFRSQLAAAEKRSPHPGDGSCDHCGKIPAIDIPTRLCDECSDGVKRAVAAEFEIQRLRERITELEQVLKGSRLRFFYIFNLATNAWRDIPNIEAVCKRIVGYAEEAKNEIDALPTAPERSK